MELSSTASNSCWRCTGSTMNCRRFVEIKVITFITPKPAYIVSTPSGGKRLR